MGLLDVLMYLTLFLGMINAGILTFLLFRLKSLNVRSLKNQINLVEADQGDLVQRFNRFQNRENLRKAREVKDDQRTLQEQASDVLAHSATQNAPISGQSRKAALRERMRSKQ